MKLPIVDKCCCCLSLRTGVLVIGGLNAASAIILLIFTIASLEAYEVEGHDTTLVISEKQNNTVIKEVDLTRFNLEAFEVYIVFFGLRLMLSVVLIVGAQKRNVVYLNIYNIYQLIQVTLLGIWLIVEIFGSPASLIFFRLIDLGFQISVYIVIRSLILEIQTTQIQEYDDNNLKALKTSGAN